MAKQMDVPAFVAKWKAITVCERAGAHSHFNDLCQLVGHPAPLEADPHGRFFAFEKGLTKSGGGKGWADVWLKDHFAWEYKTKGKHKDLLEAYRQLQLYHADLENPPLLVVCDIERIEVHTNFNKQACHIYAFTLDDLLENVPTRICGRPPLEVLRAAFEDPESLRPGQTPAEVTEDAAARFAHLAMRLRARGFDAEVVSHFLMRLLFCMFAQSTRLLRPGLFTDLLENTRDQPEECAACLADLFGKMTTGGRFGSDAIPFVNGGLFADSVALPLRGEEIGSLIELAGLNWKSIEPSVFGTLFERGLDPTKRAQLGAHYTSPEDIACVVDPVIMQPLRGRWASVRAEAQVLVGRRAAAKPSARAALDRRLDSLLVGFTKEIAAVKVLDPACGSGNFLYIALRRLLDLWQEVSKFAADHGRGGLLPYAVGPWQLFGIEQNAYAHELASIVVWIGYIQWLKDHGFGIPDKPVLRKLPNIDHADAIVARDPAGRLAEPEWEPVDYVVGNPPFLGGKLLRRQLGDAYVDQLFALYDGRVPREADLVCYWFERARAAIQAGRARRVGLLATQGIRGGASRRVLERIKGSGDIFLAWSDREWMLDGAAVHVSIVGFDDGRETSRTLDGGAVPAINANLTGALDLTRAARLPENLGIAFMGDTKGGAFDVDGATARHMLAAPLNPNGRPNSDVVRPWVNGLDVTRRPRDMWIIDFGVGMAQGDAALYELPFAHVRHRVRPERATNKRAGYRERWWIHVEPRPALRAALAPLRRFIATPNLTKHRLFTWLEHPTLPDHQLIVFARDDDYFFGVLHSRIHEMWARGTGTQLREAESGFRYTPTTTFETFPMPWSPGSEPLDSILLRRIADASRDLAEKRHAWLYPQGAGEDALGQRTLTNLYNDGPPWLAMAHERLDRAVLDAYGWPHDLSDEQLLGHLLQLNRERAAATGIARPLGSPDAHQPVEEPAAIGAVPLSDAG